MLVCHCKRVNDKKIRDEIRKGALTLDDVIKRTGCCTGCGSCEDVVQEILDEEEPKIDDKLTTPSCVS